MSKSGLQQSCGWLLFRWLVCCAAYGSGMQVMGADIPGRYRFAAHGIPGEGNSGPASHGQIQNMKTFQLAKMQFSIKLNLPYLHSERPWSNSKIRRKTFRDSRMASNAAPSRGLIPTFSGFKTPTFPLGSDFSSKYWGATNFEKQIRCQSLHDDTIF